LDSVWTLGCNRFKSFVESTRVRSAELDMHEYTYLWGKSPRPDCGWCSKRVVDLGKLDNHSLHFVVLLLQQLHLYIMTTHYYSNLDLESTKRLSNPTWWWITKLSLIGSVRKSHSQPFLEVICNCVFSIFTTSANSVSSYSSKGLLYCIVVPLPFWHELNYFSFFCQKNWKIIHYLCQNNLINLKVDFFQDLNCRPFHDNDLKRKQSRHTRLIHNIDKKS